MAKIIPALLFSAIACGLAATPAASSKRQAASRRPAARRSAARPVPKPGDLAALVRAWRDAPTPARREAVAGYAARHAKDANGTLARLAVGVVSYEQKDFAGAMAALKEMQGRLPELADYTGYFLAASKVESNEPGTPGQELAPVYAASPISPLSGKARLIEARALKTAAPADAVRLLRDHYSELPQPEGDVALADAYQAAGDLPHAADFYQRVYYEYPAGDAASRAAAALITLKDAMGAAYPAPLPEQILRRGDRLMNIGEYTRARAEYESAAGTLPESQRGRALVRVGAADFLAGRPAACGYLRGLELTEPEADAERVYYLGECGRRQGDDGAMLAAVQRLGNEHPKSPWRLKALISAASRFLLVNRPDDYVPLYRAAYENFPDAPQAALCHWKITFQAYLRDKDEAAELLREHLRRFPGHATAGAALYFLGRGAERAGDFASAAAFYRRLSDAYQNTYYAVLARGRLGAADLAGAAPSDKAREFLSGVDWPNPAPVPESETPATGRRIRRSRLLRAAGLGDLADAELRFGARNDGQSPLLAMELASAAESVHQAVRIMKSMAPDYLNLPFAQPPRKFWELLFPLPYKNDLFAYARQRNLDPYLVAGLIRQESEFNPGALSHAMAYGLTQVQPATGRLFARKAGVKRFSARALLQPGVNLKIGTSVLRSMLDQNGGSLERTLAAYNAGPNRSAEWQTWNTYREPAEFVESIPFSETRDYVQAVLRNADFYRRLYK